MSFFPFSVSFSFGLSLGLWRKSCGRSRESSHRPLTGFLPIHIWVTRKPCLNKELHTGTLQVMQLQASLEFHHFSINVLMLPQHPVLEPQCTELSLGSSLLWLCFSWPRWIWGGLVSCFEECPSIWVCLMYFSYWTRVLGFGKKIPQLWMKRCSH